MWWYWLFFFFVAFGSKVLLAFVMIYLLLPTDHRCNQCDEETLLIRMRRAGQIGSALTRGRVQWRWCPRCGWEGLARRTSARRPIVIRTVGHTMKTRS
ncbi:MAG: hypothetical protein WD766_08775 [Gemmatimonadota bacterium]